MDDIFSVVIPCYKNARYLEECLDSVLCQNYPEIELIICEDHGGKFDCGYYRDYILKHNKGNIVRVEVYSNPRNYGTVKNLNHAIKKTSGKYIKFLAADDAFFSKNAISEFVKSANRFDDLVYVCNVMQCDNNMSNIGLFDSSFYKYMNHATPSKCFEKMVSRNRINAVGVFFRKTYFEEYGLFDEKYVLLEDWPTWLKIFVHGERIRYLPIVVTRYRKNVGVVSNNNDKYLSDRKRVWKDIIKPNKKRLSTLNYIKAYICFRIKGSKVLRSVMAFFTRIKKEFKR